jgi:two-component system, NarL family, response regulator NreC
MTSIVLADDHTIVRQGLKTLLEKDFQILGEAADGLEVVELVERLKPDVLVLDVMMPGLNGIDAAREIKKRAPKTCIVILSMHSDEAYVVEALRNGVSGFVLKGSDTSELTHAINECAAGRHYLSAALSERVIQGYVEKFESSSMIDPYETLTSRERQVLHLAAEGLGNPDIATRLSISTRTAETHRANLMNKLNLHSQAELIRYAMRKGIVRA